MRKSPIKKVTDYDKKDERAAIVERAREWIGTPFLHQGRVMGVGVDCAGVIVDIAKYFNYAKDYEDKKNYPKHPTGTLMADVMGKHLDRISAAEALPGDILHFQFGRFPQHVAILTGDGTFIHADGDLGKVVETRLAGTWARQVRGAYRFRKLK